LVSKLFLQAFPNLPLFPPNFSKHFFGDFVGFQGLAIAARAIFSCSKLFAAPRRPVIAPSGRSPELIDTPSHRATSSDFPQANGAKNIFDERMETLPTKAAPRNNHTGGTARPAMTERERLFRGVA
jgi:hypothetical protein